MDWWQIQQKNYPHIYQIAKEILPIPATFTESERLFSIAKLFIGDFRQSTNPQLICNQIFFKSNKDLF